MLCQIDGQIVVWRDASTRRKPSLNLVVFYPYHNAAIIKQIKKKNHFAQLYIALSELVAKQTLGRNCPFQNF